MSFPQLARALRFPVRAERGLPTYRGVKVNTPAPLMTPRGGSVAPRPARVWLSPVEAMGWAQLLRAAIDAPASTPRPHQVRPPQAARRPGP